MKAISLWQPWASAIAVGAKRIETRHWWTAYRGPLAIHAAKKADAGVRDFFEISACDPLRAAGYRSFDDLPLGAVVATCRLAGCVFTQDVAELTEQERWLGNYERGRYAWLLEDVIALKTPVLARGAQGFFEVAVNGELAAGLPQMSLL